MYRKSLVKGIAIVLTASSIMTAAVPAMAVEPTAEVTAISAAANAQDESTQETDVQETGTQLTETQGTDTQDTDTPSADPQPSEGQGPEEQPADIPASEEADQQETPANASPASISTNDNGKPAWVEGSEKNHPVYNSDVSIANGTLAEGITKENAQEYITFTGVFGNAVIQDLQVNADRTGFKVVFTKVSYSKETDFEGGMTVKGNAIMLTDGSTSAKDLSVYMYDTYRASDGQEQMGPDAVEELLRAEGNAALKTGMSALFGTVLPGAFSTTLVDWIMKQGLNFNADAPTEPSEELKAINAMQEQLSQATKDILNGIEKVSLENAATSMNTSINTMDSQYRDCNYTLEQVKEWTESGVLNDHQASVENYMTAIYCFGNGNPNVSSAEAANFQYYNTLINLGNAMTGRNALFSTYNIFQINHGISSCLHNYNTQTFTERKDFNQKVLEYYDTGYAALNTAITYDIQKNTIMKEAYEAEKTSIQQKIEGKTLTAEAREKVNAAISALTTKITTAGNAVAQGKIKLQALSQQRENIKTLKEASDQEITTESALPYVLCYRNNEKYEKAMTVSESVPENFGTNRASFLTAGPWNFWDESDEYHTKKKGWEGTQDNKCTYVDIENMKTTPAYQSAAAYKGTKYSNMSYLAEIAKSRGLTLEEDLNTAFTYEGNASEVSGYYNGGKFTYDENHPYEGYHYYGERIILNRLPWWDGATRATYSDYYWYSINHVVDYYTKTGQAATSTYTRSFALADNNDKDIQNTAHYCSAGKTSGEIIKLFVVNMYEN